MSSKRSNQTTIFIGRTLHLSFEVDLVIHVVDLVVREWAVLSLSNEPLLHFKVLARVVLSDILKLLLQKYVSSLADYD